DSVLSLAVTAHLYPRLEAEQFGAGRLTKIRAQAVSGRSCRVVAERLRIPERLLAAAPPGAAATVSALVGTERARASVIEAVIGATIEGVEVGRGSGRSKKDAEQEAAQAALEALD